MSGFEFPPNAASDSQFTRSEPLITPEDFRLRYLFGIDLTDEHGNEIPREVFQQQINAAVSYFEHKLDIIIHPTKFVERYDYRAVDYIEFNFLQLKKRPLSSVELIKAKFPNNRDLVEYPKDWYTIDKEGSQVQLVPIEGTFSGLIITQGGSYLPQIYGTRQYWPHLFEITYTAGFDNDCIPSILNEMIGLQAALSVFEILGDITLGPGVQSESVSIDGASTSKNLSSSAMYSVYGSRIENYRRKLEDYTKTLKKYYSGLNFVVS